MARPLAFLLRLPPLTLALVAFTLGCAGSPIAAPLEGEPVCPDFKAGGVLMAGGLRYPVRVRVLDGKNVLFKTILPGLRTADAKRPSTFIVDDNAEYTVEWAQCENERAPGEATAAAHARKARNKMRDDENAGYECGEAKVYKTEKLATKKHDPASHVITFAPPPSAVCWESEAPVAAAPGAASGAPDAGAPMGVDAGVVGAGAVDAGAAGSPAPAPATSK